MALAPAGSGRDPSVPSPTALLAVEGRGGPIRTLRRKMEGHQVCSVAGSLTPVLGGQRQAWPVPLEGQVLGTAASTLSGPLQTVSKGWGSSSCAAAGSKEDSRLYIKCLDPCYSHGKPE